jgi:hypothetical protein
VGALAQAKTVSLRVPRTRSSCIVADVRGGTLMKFSLLGVGTLVTALNLVYGLGSAQTPEVVNTAIRSQLQQLGPEPMFAPPESLERLVKGAEAVVIAEIAEPGELKLVASTSPGGTPLGPLGFASYRVVMREVIYNRLQNAAPSLTPGSTIELTQLVGRSKAAAFLARRIPVAPGDQCLLFLWYPPKSDAWSILQWPLQFRKSQRFQGAAEPVAPPEQVKWLDTMWLGAAVPATTDGSVAIPRWEPLVLEVKRLATQVRP